MNKETPPSEAADCGHPHTDCNTEHSHHREGEMTRRGFVRTGVAGIAAGLAGSELAGTAWARDRDDRGRGEGHGRDPGRGGEGRRYVLRGGVVLSLDPKVGDFEEADVLIEGRKIVAVGPNLGASGHVIDCRGMIVMPGMVSTHNHQYEAIQRSIIADGLIVFAGDSDQQQTSTANALYEAYGTVVQSIWTAGRIGPANNPQWDLGRSPYDPEDCYIAELIACLSQITQGITCGTDTSQSSHTPEHTDAMIEGCIDSGRRTLFDYSNGINRDVPGVHRVPYGVPTTPERVPAARAPAPVEQVLQLQGPAGDAGLRRRPDGHSRPAGAVHRSHGLGTRPRVRGLHQQPQRRQRDRAGHGPRRRPRAVRRRDARPLRPLAGQPDRPDQPQPPGLPEPRHVHRLAIWADNGGHVSIAGILEAQMRHGMPPFQMALNHGILPSLSPDVDTNMTPDPFSMMRGAFVIQRGLANDLTFPLSDPGGLPTPQLLTSRQCVEMMTIAGAAGSGLLDKVGTLTPGKEADIVMLDYDNINIQPMNNAYGSVVTMMDTRHVRHVMIAGKFVYWNGRLLGWDVDRIVRKAVRSRDRVLARINGPAVGFDAGIIHRGKNSFSQPYRPAFLTSCCYNGQNESAPHYSLRP